MRGIELNAAWQGRDTQRRAAWAEAIFLAQYRGAVERRAQDFPASVAAHLLKGWDDRYGQTSDVHRSPVKIANNWAHSIAGELEAAKLNLAYDEDAIRDHAENYSRLCGKMRSLESRMSFAVSVGVEPPAGRTITREGAAKRLDDPMWWRRQLRKRWTRSAENSMRDIGMIRKGREPYASDEAVKHRGARQRRTREWMESHVMVNGAGEQLELLAVADRSIANTEIRRGELMTRLRGFEEIAEELGHVAEFVTLTTPSTYHAQLASGARNPLHERQRVREGQQWLCRMWARARAKLARLSILFYGFRAAEPHHDATPHWHMVLFCSPASADTLRRVVAGVWLSEYADERGAAEHRCSFKAIDPSKGSAAGYLAKYISKNIDGAGVIGDASSDETGESVRGGVARVGAWASVHGIRQFQQIGGPPVALWRELRRFREPVDHEHIERARVAASDESSFSGMVRAVGGIAAGRKTTVRVWKEQLGVLSGYGELQGAVPAGVMCGSIRLRSRCDVWRIVRRKGCSTDATVSRRRMGFRENSTEVTSLSDLGPVAITVRSDGAPALGEPAAWTSRETSMAGPGWLN